MKNNPPFRKLQGFAFDPITSLDLDTADINRITYKVPWEDLQPGPEGKYIRVIDRDPASNAIYKPVDLNAPHILATDGLTPSEANPQFHQQMVYAVVMTTIKNFEKALGRQVTWSPAEKIVEGKKVYEYVDKLLVYPHALREQNAYYSPDRKALLFGYYNATPANASLCLPGGIVYGCLSHDIVAHETTHALLDGMYSRFMETTHPDVPAFHEGFADLVALLQHFMYPEIVRNQIRKVRGDLDSETLLSQLAVEFGLSTGDYGALRSGIGRYNGKEWVRYAPNTTDYDTVMECHSRGSLLVAAVFDAFLAIYKNRTADLLRIATGGTGVLPQGELHPDLVNRLAQEACKSASHVLNMCIRALDYCPPVDINFGDYLRALITADKELVADDDQNYRVAFINAFRKRGIFPEGVPNLSVETLCYQTVPDTAYKDWFNEHTGEFLREFKGQLSYVTDRKKIFDITAAFIRGDKEKNIKGLHSYLFDTDGRAVNHTVMENLTGLVFSDQYKDLGIGQSRTYKKGPAIEIHSLRIHSRTGPDGNLQNQIIMTLAQRCRVAAIKNGGTATFAPIPTGKKAPNDADSFTFRGGCTLILNLDNLSLQHAISKPIFDPAALTQRGTRKLRLNTRRLQMQYRCGYGDLMDDMGFAPNYQDQVEPLACIHNLKNKNNDW